MPNLRQEAVADLAYRDPVHPTQERAKTSSYFGCNAFGVFQMKDKLPEDVYAKLYSAVRLGKQLELDIAPPIAQVIKDWAISRGVTHFTHWFQPQTGLTAEKHDALLSFDSEQRAIESFTAEQLIQGEPDASSFPSGGLRETWEARGYTAWNPASPVFIIESAGSRTLCIPSVFIGYNGEALDETTPLLRSADVLSEKAIELLELLGDTGVIRVYPTLGVEQEYFLIDRALFALRPDLTMAGRTVIGAPPARGQQLEDHYFGGIPERVQACISEAEYELYKLGVPVTTRHNEVAPNQFELAPYFGEADIAVDHNQLIMSTLRRVAMRHGFQALMHEKPYAGINGSGKHCNWSLAVIADNPALDGVNLLKPGNTPRQNLRFLIFLAAVLQAVHKHSDLLRAGIASAGNEHRLGANEAPPAIISVFMGKMLTEVIEEIIDGKSRGNGAQQMLKLRVARLPQIQQDNTDRNRTSPFAFTGAKFEFRAVGSSSSVAFPIALLNAAFSEALGDLTKALRKEMASSSSKDEAILKVIKRSLLESSPIRFEGNNYSYEWIEEAERRGLSNIQKTPDAICNLMTPSSKEALVGLGILTEEELESRYNVHMERYAKSLLIELNTLVEMISSYVLPAALTYSGTLAAAAANAKSAGIKSIPHINAANEIGSLIETLQQRRDEVIEVINQANALHDEEDPQEQARLLAYVGRDRMAAARQVCDALELLIDDNIWPLPKYREMLFPV